MFNQYFGYYLLNKGIITSDQLFQALHYERSVKVKLGILAVDAGLMTAAQVEEVHNLQRAKDKKFGELALEQEYLTAAQVEQLLAIQGKGHLTLLQAITDKEYLSLTVIEKALADFREEYGITVNALISPAPDDDAGLRKLLDFSQAGDKAYLLYSYAGLTLRNIVRFLNDTPFILPPVATQDQTNKWVASQQIIGDPALHVDLIMDEQTVLATATRFSGETLTVIDEMALDSIGEFLNVHNGVFCSILSSVKVDLQPQTVLEQKRQPDASGYRIVIGTSLGQFDFRLSL
ncbi:MAG TPA: chemotaxis protein CheX [Negativicutes bacterium]